MTLADECGIDEGPRAEPGYLVLDAFAGTLSTAKAFLFQDEYRRFVGCKKDSGCVETSMTGLVEVCSCQMPNDRPDLKGGMT